MKFRDRVDAGKQLAQEIQLENPENTVVLTLPRGGVPLGIEVANTFDTPHDVVLAKKLTHPTNPEFAIGAVAEGGEPIMNQRTRVEDEWIEEELPNVRGEIKRRRELYDQVLTKQPLKDKDVLIVDDGIATGMTVFAAIEAVEIESPNRIMIGVPVIPRDTFNKLEERVDEVFYLDVPQRFLGGVAAYYQSFPQLSDEEVNELLKNN